MQISKLPHLSSGHTRRYRIMTHPVIHDTILETSTSEASRGDYRMTNRSKTHSIGGRPLREEEGEDWPGSEVLVIYISAFMWWPAAQ